MTIYRVQLPRKQLAGIIIIIIIIIISIRLASERHGAARQHAN